MANLCTLKEVAKEAGVSEGTASMVINGKPGPTAKTRIKVWEVARRLNYVPNASARSLAKKELSTVGLVISDIENPFFGSITRYVHKYLEKRNLSMIVSLSNNDLKTEVTALQNFMHRGVRAVIICPTHLSQCDPEIFERLRERKIPVVFVTSYYDNYPAPRVLTDYSKGSYELTRYLLNTGHTDIRFLVSRDPNAPISRERINGFLKAYSDCGISPSEKAIHCCHFPDYNSGFSEASMILNRDVPHAIIAINDVLAMGAKHAALNSGFRIPDDISIGGYDDVCSAVYSEIPLTTVRQDIERIARLAVDVVLSERGMDENTDVRVGTSLLVRRSTEKKNHSTFQHQTKSTVFPYII